MRILRFFVFLHRYAQCIRVRLEHELGRVPTYNEKLSRYKYAFHHLENIRTKVRHKRNAAMYTAMYTGMETKSCSSCSSGIAAHGML